MKRKLVVAMVGAGAVAAALAGLGASGTNAASPVTCPSALGAACGTVDVVTGTLCYGEAPQIPTVGPVTLDLEGRLLSCPEL